MKSCGLISPIALGSLSLLCCGLIRLNVGRLRYLDLGFFESSFVLEEEISASVLRSSALGFTDVRPTLGQTQLRHLLLLAGSDYAGAAMMAAQAALKAGVGLLTVGIPESCTPPLPAQRPEACGLLYPRPPRADLPWRVWESTKPARACHCPCHRTGIRK